MNTNNQGICKNADLNCQLIDSSECRSVVDYSCIKINDSIMYYCRDPSTLICKDISNEYQLC
jgi:hypothetical protein